MVSIIGNDRGLNSTVADEKSERVYEKWMHWPINWSAIWVGALASLAAVLLFGLIGLAIGAHTFSSDSRVVDLKKVGIATVIFSVCGAFFAFMIGGWVAGKIGGILHAEPALLNGAIVWLVGAPIILILAGLGAGSLFGGWYAGLSGTSTGASASPIPIDKPDPLLSDATPQERAQYNTAMNDYREKVRQWREDTPKVTRNAALGATTALLLSLMGAVAGAWLASGETFAENRQRHERRTVARV